MTLSDYFSTSSAPRLARSRRGAIYFAELILVMPILMIMFLAVVQFGIFFTNLQILSFASRVGAIAASETTVDGSVPTSVTDIVTEHLEANGFDGESLEDLCIHIQTNALNGTTPDCPHCEPSVFNAPDGELPNNTTFPTIYYRVNVCLPQDVLMPNLLQPFGYDITGDDDVVNCATVMQREFDVNGN